MRNCNKGKPCGNSCIKKAFTCNTPIITGSRNPSCNKGKPCGKACIKKDYTCNIPATQDRDPNFARAGTIFVAVGSPNQAGPIGDPPVFTQPEWFELLVNSVIPPTTAPAA